MALTRVGVLAQFGPIEQCRRNLRHDTTVLLVQTTNVAQNYNIKYNRKMQKPLLRYRNESRSKKKYDVIAG